MSRWNNLETLRRLHLGAKSSDSWYSFSSSSVTMNHSHPRVSRYFEQLLLSWRSFMIQTPTVNIRFWCQSLAMKSFHFIPAFNSHPTCTNAGNGLRSCCSALWAEMSATWCIRQFRFELTPFVSPLPADGSFSHGDVTVADLKASRRLVQRGTAATGRTGPHSR